jgi:hypothetical protein
MLSKLSLFVFQSVLIGILLTLCDYYCHTRQDVLVYHPLLTNTSTSLSLKQSSLLSFPFSLSLSTDLSSYLSLISFFPLFSLFPSHPTSIILLNFIGIGFYCTVTGWIIFKEMKPISMFGTIVSLFLFVLCYYLSGFLKEYPMTINNFFLILWGFQLNHFQRPEYFSKLLGYSILLGTLGPVVEGYFSGVMGFFQYYDVDAYYVPCWLSGLYLNGGLAIAATTTLLESWTSGKNEKKNVDDKDRKNN